MTTAFTFHARSDAAAALLAAVEAGCGVTLVTPPDGADHAGPEFYLAAYRAACDDVPRASSEALVDCGRDAGTAMRALRAGWRRIILDAGPDVNGRVADLAAQSGASCDHQRPETIDLLTTCNPVWTCRQALDNHKKTTERQETEGVR